jgi:nucleotide-binding universal stress UspA family protein
MYKHILAALDGSPRAPQVLRHAADLAARSGAVLHLVRAVTVPVGVPDDSWVLNAADLTSRMLAHGGEDLGRLAAGLHPHVTPIRWGERVCRLGPPAPTITDVARELGADLIVIGSHGYGLLDRILGTTASRVVHHAPCNVMVARVDDVAAVAADEQPAAAGQPA